MKNSAALTKCLAFVRKLKSSRDLEMYVVGGAVRDLFLKRPISDIDLTTNLQRDDLISLFESLKLSFYIKHKGYSTVCVRWYDTEYEVTPYRCDVLPLGRQAIIAPAKTLKEDLSRRDFTYNAMCLDERGRVIDLHGGLRDLRERNTRFIGKASDRLREDRLRAYRFIRFMILIDDRHISYKFNAIKIRGYWKAVSVNRKLEEYSKTVKTLYEKEGYVKYLLLLIKQGYFETFRCDDIAGLCGTRPEYFAARLYDLNRDLDRFLNNFSMTRSLRACLREKERFADHPLSYLRWAAYNSAIWNDYADSIFEWYRDAYRLIRAIKSRINYDLIFRLKPIDTAKDLIRIIIYREWRIRRGCAW